MSESGGAPSGLLIQGSCPDCVDGIDRCHWVCPLDGYATDVAALALELLA